MKGATASGTSTWRRCYTAALLEKDCSKVPALIADAESEIVKRARLLFVAQGDNFEEIEALDDALYMLRALKSCVKAEPTDSAAA